MANRIGLELLQDCCRVVDVQPAAAGWLSRRNADAGSRVKRFHVLPYTPGNAAACAAELKRLLGGGSRDIRIAIWGLKATHQVFTLPSASPADLELVARREARTRTPGAAAPVAPIGDGVMVGDRIDDGRREVGYVSVPAADIQARLQPFLDAGLTIKAAVTPAVAHATLVRQRWGQFGDAATAVLAVNARATAMTVVRAGVVVFSREMPWGHQTDRVGAFDAAAFAGQLAAELRRSLVFLKQQSKVDVGHVLLCGDLPDLRALTGPLMHELNVEVETLDSLEGFDLAHLPDPADEFRSRVGALRTAWALAADAELPVTLQPRGRADESVGLALDQRARTGMLGAAVLAALIVVAAWLGSAYLLRSHRAQAAALRAQAGVLTPQVRQMEDSRRTAAVIAARQAALDAFATQGPRLARVLEALAAGAPGELAISAVTLTSGPGTWRVTVAGRALADSPERAQATFNQFLAGVTASPLLGQPVAPPTLDVRTSEPASIDETVTGGVATLRSDAPAQLEALQRPRNVVVADPGAPFSAQAARAGEVPRGARVMAEPHWQLHPGGVPRDVAAGIATYNAEQRATAAAVQATAAAAAPAGERQAASSLAFTIRFEVRK